MTLRHRMTVRGWASRGRNGGFSLVEMLVAMAITLIMMGAVVTLFANISGSVRDRRATIEMTSQVRHLRNVLQQDLQGATCPGITWPKPEANLGYIEIIEGQRREGDPRFGYPSKLVDGINLPGAPDFNPEIDHITSVLPSTNMQPFTDAAGVVHSDWATDGGGLGDYDDTLLLTVRNEHQPFVGRMPAQVRPSAAAADPFDRWGAENIESTLAEVIWFAVENPESDSNANNFFGEPGMRTIYRRTLLIAPWINPYRFTATDGTVDDTFTHDGDNFKAEPGLVRLLPKKVKPADVADALAAVVAFQDRYDLSVRLEWDQNIQRWKIMANTLGDLTKRENRFGHFGFRPGSGTSDPSRRIFAYPLLSWGSGYSGVSQPVEFVNDPDYVAAGKAPTASAVATANMTSEGGLGGLATSYTIDKANYTDPARRYQARPFVFVNDTPSGVPATAQAMLNDDGSVVRVLHGPVPLWGERRGEDVMMSDVLAFDLRVYDPGAPLFGTWRVDKSKGLDVVLSPSDPGWRGTPPKGTDGAYLHDPDNMKSDGTGAIGTFVNKFPFVGQGAYVDMGYGYDANFSVGPTPGSPFFPTPRYKLPDYASAAPSWFFSPRAISDVFGNAFSPGYCAYDTWSFHYENNGIDEDGSGTIDQGTNGLDDRDFRTDPPFNEFDAEDWAINGVDDVGERETTPPYDKPLRGMQALIRTYERDSRAIRQVRVNQHFMPE